MVRNKTTITFEEASRLLAYDPETGILTWKVDRGSATKAGDKVGSIGASGYVEVSMYGASYKAHRIIWLLTTGSWPTNYVDHINTVKVDNRLVNLRDATPQENRLNRDGTCPVPSGPVTPRREQRVIRNPTYEEVSEVLRYDPITGIVVRNRAENRWKEGTIVGSRRNDGYLAVCVHGVVYLLHRVIWLLYYKEWPVGIIDHIDGNKQNNSINNLRLVTASENNKNRCISKYNKSGVTGVYWASDRQKWRASIGLNNKKINLGTFANKEDAIAAYNKASAELYPRIHKVPSETK